MAEDGSVSRAVVLRVLKAHGIDLLESTSTNPFPLTTAAKGIDPKETLQVHPLPEIIRRRMLHYLARKYGVPVHHFHNENMAPKDPTLAPVAKAKAVVLVKTPAKTASKTDA